MLKTLISLIIVGVIINVTIAQNNILCDEIRKYEFPENFDDESIKALKSNISKLSICGYDSIEIKLLQNNSFMGALVNEAINKMIRSNNIKNITLNMLLLEFDFLRNDNNYQSKKEELLKYHIQNSNTIEKQKITVILEVYPNSRSKYEINNKNKHKSILYFTNAKCKNCNSFENIVLKNENLAQLINENFDFYILQTDYNKRKSDSEEKINYDIQIKLFETNVLPFLGILDENGKVIGKIHYRLDTNNIYNNLNKYK